MAWNETKLTATGRIITDVKTRTLPDGTLYADFTLAANERRYDPDTKEWVAGKSLYLRVKCYRKLAEKVAATLTVRDPVMVTGRVYTDKYETDSGPRSDLTLDAKCIGPDLSLCDVVIERKPSLLEPAA
ncbi:single-stranded DNA-binding protein [Actinocrispum wychmicini]|uniref:Single-strand DNA-binding protein n=1 Tax=Actinocrispum wychmicini TaxID=1213861 RepID=A0A4R2IZE9_9PSEU|nr:single-stranded DNA-binding protein [Actinocrispum wychmicini]TCO50707.1 single-strand DNA-binding protein [Actinocrispum wychmicini]